MIISWRRNPELAIALSVFGLVGVGCEEPLSRDVVEAHLTDVDLLDTSHSTLPPSTLEVADTGASDQELDTGALEVDPSADTGPVDGLTVGPLPSPETWSSQESLRIRRMPHKLALRRGLTVPGESFEVSWRISLRGCQRNGWGRVGPEAWVCLDEAVPSEQPAVTHPQLVAFDAPEPAEWETYVSTGTYDRAPSDEADALVPFIYGKRWRRWKAKLWSSEAALLGGWAPAKQLGRVAKYAFVKARETDLGTVLVRRDGSVALADDVHVYPITRFGGEELGEESRTIAERLGWAVSYSGTPLLAGPSWREAEVARLDYQVALTLGDEQGGFVEVLGPGPRGWAYRQDIRRVDVQPRPADVSDTALWLDVDLDEQVLIALRGDTPVYATLVSTGKGRRWATPTGLYRIYDKAAWWHMSSRPGAAEPYHVENVPWTMHFYPRYALHGAFWHWGFGHTASHGCVNLAPRDAAWIYDRISPSTHPGWLLAYERPHEPGTVLRVRYGDQILVRDRRKPPR